MKHHQTTTLIVDEQKTKKNYTNMKSVSFEGHRQQLN